MTREERIREDVLYTINEWEGPISVDQIASTLNDPEDAVLTACRELEKEGAIRGDAENFFRPK